MSVQTVEKTIVVPVLTRQYSVVNAPSTPPKGKQRQIVLNILLRENKPMGIAEVAKIWDSEFRNINVPVDGILNSVRYHLHHLTLLGITKY